MAVENIEETLGVLSQIFSNIKSNPSAFILEKIGLTYQEFRGQYGSRSG